MQIGVGITWPLLEPWTSFPVTLSEAVLQNTHGRLAPGRSSPSNCGRRIGKSENPDQRVRAKKSAVKSGDGVGQAKGRGCCHRAEP